MPDREPKFPNLARGLTGISGRAIETHLRVFSSAWRELQSIGRERRRQAWTAPAGAVAGASPIEVQHLLETRVGALGLKIEGRLAVALQQLRGDLNSKGISWFPSFYLGDGDFWTTDRATSINVPWFLANDKLWWLVNEQTARYTEDEVLKIIRHEAGHAVGYAFELWKRPGWRETFGDMDEPYRDAYEPDPKSTDFVRYLHRSGPNAQMHYAQKHPDEDWAETFATWIGDPGWRAEYAAWPGALRKLEFVEDLIANQGAAYGDPPNKRPGRRSPYTQIGETVADNIGLRSLGEWSPRSALLAREGRAAAEVRLHELHFEALRRAAQLSLATDQNSQFGAAAAAAFGSFDAWAEDARAICGSVGGWLLTVWDGARVHNLAVDGAGAGVPPGAAILLAVCLHEHAYAPDYGARKDLYLGAVFRNVDWGVVSDRLAEARRAPLPQGWGVTYAEPNADGERKACANCTFPNKAVDRCKVVDGPISPAGVCGYHVERGKQVPLELAGYETVPGGTSCDLCRFYTPRTADAGDCLAVVDTGGRGPFRAAARGCCSRWEAA